MGEKDEEGQPQFLGGQKKGPEMGGEMVRMEILRLILIPDVNAALIMLRDMQGKRIFPIRIGSLEANTIALGIKEIQTPRPMTHDLMKNILEEFRVEVVKVVITALKGDTFCAEIHIMAKGKEMEIDCRPSDAIALAVRLKIPIYCAEKALESAADQGLLKQSSDFEGRDSLNEWLESLKPDDLGKYKM
jgi:bifunctional DNase/RNase